MDNTKNKTRLNEHGWVLYHSQSGTIWADSFQYSRKMCLAVAVGFWASVGETRKENAGWKPVKAFRMIEVDK